MTRGISSVLAAAGGLAVAFSVYQVVAGHAAFSWVWLMATLPTFYGIYLFGSYALRGHLPVAMAAEQP